LCQVQKYLVNAIETVAMTGGKKKSKTPGKKRGVILVKHTNLVLDIDVEKAILAGYTEIQASCKVRKLPTIKLHARQVNIQKVYLQDVACEFEYRNYLDTPCESSIVARDVCSI
jgi:aminopeptidase N